MNSMQIAERNGANWGSNDATSFTADFAPSALIHHPFFRQAVTPKIAVEVMNATVCGTTQFDGCRLLKGTGDGIDDLVEMHFIETGECADYRPQYLGRMVVFARIVDEAICHLKVKGYDLVHARPTQLRPFEREPIGRLNSHEMAHAIAESWSGNDMGRFTSLFGEGAMIIHPLFSAPITPEIAADVLNSAMRGVSEARGPKLLLGDGAGEFDIADMWFDETGDQIGFLPDTMGVMHSTVRIEGGSISEMIVHGYTPEKTRFSRDLTALRYEPAIAFAEARVAEFSFSTRDERQ
ncbi:MAG TPA: hypothetical protein VMF58_16120 [Rhizomicrobium sp.]|nr:hypothetical protein [Rhizomicrobium sp.]